ncbi:MAG: DUF1553 domain-containing protein, partial [Planctomycetes bacterium]|nr:DUF1553 domain-containing protein [Planctomycetota bacterium]
YFARATTNRVWAHLFGRGLVRTMNDFGVRGDRPTHPELLDWLAAEHGGAISGQLSAISDQQTAASGQQSTDDSAESGPRPSTLDSRPSAWSRKALVRLIVTSAAYRQSSRHRAELAEVDPRNDLLHRQNRFRVEAEIVRDLSLAAADLLATKVGGPSVFPPLPADVAALSYAGNFKWKDSAGLDRYRRGMYTFFKRTAPHPNLTTFDCPDANTTTVMRGTSNTPLMALTTLNNDVFVEASQALARRILSRPELTTDADRLTFGFRLCVARPPSEEELTAFGDLLAQSREWYAAHAEAAKQLTGARPPAAPPEEAAAWVAASRILLNLDEFITRE